MSGFRIAYERPEEGFAGRLPTPVRAESDAIESLTPREFEVLAKLSLGSRIRAVIFAYESGMITPCAPRP